MKRKRSNNSYKSNNQSKNCSNGSQKRNYGNKGRDSRKQLRDDLSHERDSGQYQQTEERLSSLNDISWYNRYSDLLSAAGTFPFPNRPGMVVKYGDYKPSAGNTVPISNTIPGVWGMYFYPSIGYSDANYSPASQAAKEWYAKVRSKFSGSLEADAPDFLMYVMALDSIHAYIANLKRIYRTIDAWSPNNYATPYDLLNLYGFRTDGAQTALRGDKVLLFQYINTLIRQVEKFTCPDVMDILKRHRWMNENVYMDGTTPNSQMYTFVQKGYYIMGTDTNGAGKLAITALSEFDAETYAPGVIAAELYDFGLTLIEALNSEDTSYTISGYLMRAFEGTPNVTVPLLAQDETLVPVYQPEVMTQIENARIVRISVSSLNITQDPATNTIMHTPTTPVTNVQDFRNVINLRTDFPGASNVAVATRLQPAVVDSKVFGGTEIVTNYRLVATPVTGGVVNTTQSWEVSLSSNVTILNTTDDGTAVSIGTTNWKLMRNLLWFSEQFDMHPFLYVLQSGGR